jgi:pimeloyl-ACP methyl ester carboxylesterase
VTHSIREECDVRGGRRTIVDFGAGRDRFAGILLLPACATPVAAALLLHGFTLDKERMAESVGVALLGRGVASLAIDLPLHGERYQAVNLNSIRTPFELLARWRGALSESSLALEYLAALPGVDPNRLALVGYSLGGFLGVQVASREPAVRALVLAATGDIPDYVPFAGMVRKAVDPLDAIRRVAGRPLLMVHGRHDRTVPPAQAERLFRAASEPKELRWWETGHSLPADAIDDAARWLAARLEAQIN